MFKTKLIISQLILCCFVLMHVVSAQDFENYTPMKCAGAVPEDFKNRATDKYLKDKDAISKSNEKTKDRKKSEKKFSLTSNFQINDLLFSGRVLFGDPASVYISKVADELLKNNLELRAKLRFYVFKSEQVNAFTTQQGIIFINLGLLAHLHSEAELAFVLSHEIGHFALSHVLEGFVAKENIKRGVGNYRKLGINDRIEEFYRYSKKSESEADLWGLTLYNKSSYHTNAIYTMFDVLKFADHSFDTLNFSYNFIEDKVVKLPKKYILLPIKIDYSNLDIEEESDDSKHTHPNIGKRKKAIREALKKTPGTKVYYIVSEESFKLVQKMARFEVCMLELSSGKFSSALYDAWLLYSLYPEKKFAQKVMLMAMYGNTNYRYKYDKMEYLSGKAQLVSHFFSQLSTKESLLLTSGYAWQLKEAYPTDLFIKKIAENSIAKLISKESIRYNDFIYNVSDINKKEGKETDSDSDEVYFSYDSTQNVELKNRPKKLLWKNIFLSLNDDTKTRLKSVYEYQSSLINSADKVVILSKAEKTKTKKEIEANGPQLGVDKVLMLNPYYFYVEKSMRTNMILSEAGETNMVNQLIEIKNNNQSQIQMVDITADDAQLLHDLNVNNEIQTWLGEFMYYDDSSVVLFESQYTDVMADEIGTEHVGLVAAVRLPRVKMYEKAGFKAFLSCGAASFLSPLFLATAAYQALFSYKYFSQYIYVLINFKTNEVVYTEFKEFNGRWTNELMGQLLYYSIKGINNKHK